MAESKKEALNKFLSQRTEKEKQIADTEKKIQNQQTYLRIARHDIIRPLVVLILMVVTTVAFTLALRNSTVWDFFSKIATDDPEEWSVDFVKQAAYTCYGLSFLVIVPIGAGVLGLVLTIVGLIGSVITETAIIVIAGYLAVVIRLLKRLAEPSGYKKTLRGLEKELETEKKELADINELVQEMEAYIAKAVALYQRGICEENLELIRQAADMENADAQNYLSMLRAKELYGQAMAGEEIDRDLLEEAADLNYPPACAEYGKVLWKETQGGMYTASEKEDLLCDAAEYLQVAASDGDIEAEFLCICSRSQYESNTREKWQAMLDRVRKIKASGKLSENWTEACDELIKALVEIIDSMRAKENSAPKVSEPRLKRRYCAYENAGMCSYYSTSSYLAHCKYMSDPGDCSAALLNKALRYEYY